MEELRSHPDSFTEDGLLIGPWETTELVASAAARNAPQRILLWVDSEERRARHEAIHGRTAGSRTSFFIEPEDCSAYDEKYGKPARQLLRLWCESEPVRFDELVELRREIRRVHGIAQGAIDLLEQSNATAATTMSAELRVSTVILRPESAG